MHCLQNEFKFCACTVFKNHLIVYFRTYIQENPYFNISFCLIFSKNLFLNPLCHFFRPWINLLLQKWMMTFYLLLLIWKKTHQMKIKIQVINLKKCKISAKNTYLKDLSPIFNYFVHSKMYATVSSLFAQLKLQV